MKRKVGKIKLNKILIILIAILIISVIFPHAVKAQSWIVNAGGNLLDPIFRFLTFLGDAVMQILQKSFITPQPVVAEAKAESQGSWNWLAFIVAIVAIIGMVIGAIVTGGALAPTAGLGITAIIKGTCIGTLIFLGSTTAAVVSVAEFVGDLGGKFDIPMISYTPFTIFSGQVPAFDVNFIEPMDEIIIKEETSKEGIIRNFFETSTLQPEETFSIGLKYTVAVPVPLTHEISGAQEQFEQKINEMKNKYNISYNDQIDTSEVQPIVDGDAYTRTYGKHTLKEVYLKEKSDGGAVLLIASETTKTTYDEYGSVSTTSGQIKVWNLSQEQVEIYVNEQIEYESTANILQKGISTWYNTFRKIALVVLLSMLIFVGIKMILTSVADKKAKYKKFLIDWLTAICLLFVLHYLMLFILTISTKITKIFLPRSATIIECTLPEGTTIDGYDLTFKEGTTTNTVDGPYIELGKEGKLTWYGDFVGYVRLKAGLESKWQSVQYAVIYLVLVVYTCIFTVMYIKRTLYMAFFTMIAPLIAVTYPLDKIKDGEAQAFSLWFKEYTFNALIQPVHLIIYTMTISTVMDMLVTKHPIYALVALGFIMPAEKFLRKMFGFEKASTLSAMGQMAGGAMLYSGVQKLAGLGKKKDKDKDKEKDKPVRTADKKGIKLPEAGKSDKATGVGIGEKSNGGTGVGEKVHPKVDRNQHTAQTAIPKANLATNSKHSVKRGLQKMGMRAGKKVIKAKPVKKLGRFAGKVAGAAALGSVGAIAGISSGDFDKTLSYTAGAATVGAKVGGNLSDNIWDEAGNIRKDFTKGYLGEAEYNNRELNKEFYMSDDWIDILNDNGIYSDLKGRDRERAIRETTQEYLDSGIDDPKKIQEGMKCGLSTEEAIYAIKLAESIGKDDWNDPDKRAAFQAKYQSALGDNANEIWKNIDRFV